MAYYFKWSDVDVRPYPFKTPSPMSKRIILRAMISAAFLVGSGCIKEISSDERLERDTARSEALQSAGASELAKMKCDDLTVELSKAQEDNGPEDKRLGLFLSLFERVKQRNAKFEEALSREPDLGYQQGSNTIIAARDGCIHAEADIRLGFEGLIREIIKAPVVDELRDRKTVKAERMSFVALRSAIDKLGLDDKESLFSVLEAAEKTIENQKRK